MMESTFEAFPRRILGEVDGEVSKEIVPRQMEVAGASVSHRVGESWLVVVSRHVTMVALVDAEQT